MDTGRDNRMAGKTGEGGRGGRGPGKEGRTIGEEGGNRGGGGRGRRKGRRGWEISLPRSFLKVGAYMSPGHSHCSIFAEGGSVV